MIHYDSHKAPDRAALKSAKCSTKEHGMCKGGRYFEGTRVKCWCVCHLETEEGER